MGFGTFLILENDTTDAVANAIEVGYRHIDTAAVYNNETGVGLGIKNSLLNFPLSRSDIFITTKLWRGYNYIMDGMGYYLFSETQPSRNAL